MTLDRQHITERLQSLIETLQDKASDDSSYDYEMEINNIGELKDLLSVDGYQDFYENDFVTDIISKIYDIVTNNSIVLTDGYEIISLSELCRECLRAANVIKAIVKKEAYIIDNNNNNDFETQVEGVYIDYTYNIPRDGAVFLGRNGCGKTTLAKEIAKLTNACLIRANRSFSINEVILIQESIENIRKAKFEKAVSEYLDDNAIILFSDRNKVHELEQILSEMLVNRRISREKIFREVIESKSKQFGEDFISNLKSDIDYVIELWNDFFHCDNIELFLNDSYELKLRKGTKQSSGYNITEMSDGEKHVLYIVAMIVYAVKTKHQRIVVVDEPEKHLHKSLLSELWDKLEYIFEECKFIYFSHDIDFIESRLQTKYWLKNLNHDTYETEIEKLDSNDEIPYDLYQLLGINKKVIFCEGDKNSYDYKIYSVLFPSWKVIPCGGCASVISNTKLYRKISQNDQYVGIVDRDYRSDDEISLLAENNIYVLEVAEVENLFLQKDFIKKYISDVDDCQIAETRFKEIKVSIAIWMRKFIEQQTNNYVCWVVNKMIEKFRVDAQSNEEDTIQRLRMLQGVNVEQIKEEFISKVMRLTNGLKVTNFKKPQKEELKQSTISDNDFNDIIKCFNEKSASKAVEQAIQLQNYTDRAYRKIQNNKEYRDLLVKGLPNSLQTIYKKDR